MGGDGHSSFSYIPRDVYSWDGENSWEWDYARTLYFEPVAGLGNRLRALGSFQKHIDLALARASQGKGSMVRMLQLSMYDSCSMGILRTGLKDCHESINEGHNNTMLKLCLAVPLVISCVYSASVHLLANSSLARSHSQAGLVLLPGK